MLTNLESYCFHLIHVALIKKTLFLSASLFLAFIVLSCKDRGENLKDSQPSDTLLVFICRLDICNEIRYIKGTAGIQLPENLIILPSSYNIDGVNFTVEQEGLLRILFIGDRNYQRIVFHEDTLALLSALSWILTHGNADKSKTQEELTDKATSDKLYLTCGPASKWAVNILRSVNIDAREVMTLITGQFNDYDNGHNMIEVKEGDRWLLYDIDNNSYFTLAGRHLNLIEFRECVEQGNYKINKLSEDLPVYTGWIDQSKNYDFTFYAELRLISEKNLRKWYKRIIDMVLIESGDTMFFPVSNNENLNKRILRYSANINGMDSTMFYKKFYSN